MAWNKSNEVGDVLRMSWVWSYDVDLSIEVFVVDTFSVFHVLMCCVCVQDILAVGYGSFNAREYCDGLVCCWSIKNPEVGMPVRVKGVCEKLKCTPPLPHFPPSPPSCSSKISRKQCRENDTIRKTEFGGMILRMYA